MEVSKRVVAVLTAVTTILFIAGLAAAVNLTMSFTTTISSGSLAGNYSYVVFVDGSTYYARNGLTGRIDYTGTNGTSIITSAINATSQAGGGTVYFQAGTYQANVTMQEHVNLIGENLRNTVINGSLTCPASGGESFDILHPCKIQDLTINGPDEYAIILRGSGYEFVDLRVGSGDTSNAGIWVNGTVLHARFIRVCVSYAGYPDGIGLLIDYDSYFYLSTFYFCTFGHQDYGILHNSTYTMVQVHFIDCTFEGCHNRAVQINSMTRCIFDNIWVGDSPATIDQYYFLLNQSIMAHAENEGNVIRGGMIATGYNDNIYIGVNYTDTIIENLDFYSSASNVTIDASADYTQIINCFNFDLTTQLVDNSVTTKVIQEEGEYKNINRGVESSCASGTAILHGVATTPNVILLTPSTATDVYVSAVNATHLTIGVGAGTPDVYWYVEYQP